MRRVVIDLNGEAVARCFAVVVLILKSRERGLCYHGIRCDYGIGAGVGCAIGRIRIDQSHLAVIRQIRELIGERVDRRQPAALVATTIGVRPRYGQGVTAAFAQHRAGHAERRCVVDRRHVDGDAAVLCSRRAVGVREAEARGEILRTVMHKAQPAVVDVGLGEGVAHSQDTGQRAQPQVAVAGQARQGERDGVAVRVGGLEQAVGDGDGSALIAGQAGIDREHRRLVYLHHRNVDATGGGGRAVDLPGQQQRVAT